MNTNNYTFRTATSDDDICRLRDLFNLVFKPDPVGDLAQSIALHHPNSKHGYWYLLEDTSGVLIAGFTLIPWTWYWYGKTLNIAEQGIVATHPDHRGQGVQRCLNDAFDKTLKDEQFDLAIIQGIPGFYHQFNYRYALPIENHINLQWHQIPQNTDTITFRMAEEADIPFLMQQEKSFAERYQSFTVRSAEVWKYLLTESKKTEYGSDFWIAEEAAQPLYYCRRPFDGFGDGLIVSEVTESLNYLQGLSLLAHLKKQGEILNKPYLRLNLANDSVLASIAQSLGAPAGKPYAFQIKIPDLTQWLQTQKPIFEQRLLGSTEATFSGRFRIDSYRRQIDIVFEHGKIVSIEAGKDDSDAGICMPEDLLPPFLLGAQTWQTLRETRPDVIPHGGVSKLLIDLLFPPTLSWHQIPY